MEHISKFLAQRIKQSGFSQQVKTSLIIEEFNKLIEVKFGAKLSKKIKPLYLKDKILTVACLNSIIVQELTFQKAELIEKINKKFGPKAITEIKFLI